MNRSSQLHIRISDKEKALFEKYCDWNGYTVTEALLKHIREMNKAYLRTHPEPDKRQLRMEV